MVKFTGYFRSGCFNVYNSLFPLTKQSVSLTEQFVSIKRTLCSNMQKHFVPIRKNTLFLHIRTLCFSILEQGVHRYELTD